MTVNMPEPCRDASLGLVGACPLANQSWTWTPRLTVPAGGRTMVITWSRAVRERNSVGQDPSRLRAGLGLRGAVTTGYTAGSKARNLPSTRTGRPLCPSTTLQNDPPWGAARHSLGGCVVTRSPPGWVSCSWSGRSVTPSPASPPAPTKVTVAADVNATPSPVMRQAPPVPTPVPTLTTAAVTASPVPTRLVTQHVVVLHGVAEPDRSLTPGSVLSGSTKARICTPGYTRTVRHVSAATRRSVFQAFRIAYPPARGAYELDHLIPLELGGGNAATNLWPEPSRGVGSAGVKDQLENHLHALVCSGQLGLLQAQRAIAGDWYAAASQYNSVRVATATVSRPAPAATGTTAAVPASSGATAQCNDGTYSFAAHHQGACSRHGGVRVFFR